MTYSRQLQNSIPSVDRVLQLPRIAGLIGTHGREAVLDVVRHELELVRSTLLSSTEEAIAPDLESIALRVDQELHVRASKSLRRVFNLTGVVLHTNLGRAELPAEAISAIAEVGLNTANLEFDVETGRRSDRDLHSERLLAQLTGAERATVVNNNAAAVLLVLNTLANRKEVIVSRGELVEIGGEFRLPDIMKRAGCRLVEVGTTNRTHLDDYAKAINSRTAMILKVHPSNYQVVGFVKSVDETSLIALGRKAQVPIACDLGAGALVDLRRWGLPYERTPAEMMGLGVDLVTFSGDKLVGGPQAGMVVGRGDLVERINRNALKRALRLDKLRIAALTAVLRLYANADRLPERLPLFRHLCRPVADIEAQARRLQPVASLALNEVARVDVEACEAQIGSGSLPGDRLPSFALAIRPLAPRRRATSVVEQVAKAFRSLPVPVIGRVASGVLYLDLRCLSDEECFVRQLGQLVPSPSAN